VWSFDTCLCCYLSAFQYSAQVPDNEEVTPNGEHLVLVETCMEWWCVCCVVALFFIHHDVIVRCSHLEQADFVYPVGPFHPVCCRRASLQ